MGKFINPDEISFFEKNKKTIILSTLGTLVFVGLIIFCIFLFKDDSKPSNPNPPIVTEYQLELLGENTLSIQEGTEYIEPGFSAYQGEVEVTDKVEVTGEVDINKVGTYTITYKIGDKTLTRKVEVVKLEVTFELIGGEVSLNLKESYKEQGFKANDSKGNDLSKYVKVVKNINVNQPGTYYVTYTLQYKNKKIDLKRKVTVLEPLNLMISYDNKTYQKEITLKLNIKGAKFDKVLLPNKEVKKEKNFEYKIRENGNYTFILYDTSGKTIERSINVTNIDNVVENASCKYDVELKRSIITVTASDKSGIKGYQYASVTYLNNKIYIDKRINNVSVNVYDKLGNMKTINCTLGTKQELDGFILIGDSRFEQSKALGNKIKSTDTIVAKGGMGWEYFLKTQVPFVTNMLKRNPNKKYYIMSNMGGNDIKTKFDTATYGKKLSELAKGDWANAVVVFVSINPQATKDPNSEFNKLAVAFNEKQKKDLDGVYYCDTYNGIGVTNFNPRTATDVAHYSPDTNLAVYEYIRNNCNF